MRDAQHGGPSEPSSSTGQNVIDVSALLDNGRWSGAQMIAVALAALAIIFDGLDNQLLGLATPAIIAEWGIGPKQLRPVLVLGLIGMGLGAALGGLIGDRFGRRSALIWSVLGFGVLTVLISLADKLWVIAVLRFFIGIGLGAALPNAAALASEFVPRRHRSLAITLTLVCVPLGGTLAGAIAAQVLPDYGWRALFVIGGSMPVVIALLLFFVLPESPRYLAQQSSRWKELARTLVRFGYATPANAAYVDTTEKVAHERASLRALLIPEFRWDTLWLWGAYFFCLMAVYSGFAWIPLVLAQAGFDPATTSYGLAASNFGGVAAAILCGIVIPWLGSRATMLTFAAGAVIGSVAAFILSTDQAMTAGLAILLLGVIGACVNASMTSSFALAAHVYPTALRATGTGAALAVGRGGAIFSVFAGAAVLDQGGPGSFFMLLAGAMAFNFIGLAAVRRHIPAGRG
jgi:MFS transporter, AAHS family, 4-hydroxybenzoate transporter